MECYEKFAEYCNKRAECGDCKLYDWKEGDIPEGTLDDPLAPDGEKSSSWPAKPDDKRYTALATFEIDIGRLWKKNANTYYSPSTHTWKDGVVFKFTKGIPERGQPCIAVFKWDNRYKYHDYVKGMSCGVGRGMPTKRDEWPHYGIRPVVYVYPAVKDPDRPEIRYRLIYTQWDTRHTTRGGRSSGSLVDTDEGKVIYQVTGSESSATGNHGAIHVCAVVEGRPTKRMIRISNDTCNYHEHEEMA